MIKAFGFSNINISKLAAQIEDYCARHNITKNQIISLEYKYNPNSTDALTALLVYEEGENNDIQR